MATKSAATLPEHPDAETRALCRGAWMAVFLWGQYAGLLIAALGTAVGVAFDSFGVPRLFAGIVMAGCLGGALFALGAIGAVVQCRCRCAVHPRKDCPGARLLTASLTVLGLLGVALLVAWTR